MARLLGEVIASVVASHGASPEITLACGSAAWGLGLKQLSDLRRPYSLHATGQASPVWEALGDALQTAGVPAAATGTVMSALASELVTSLGLQLRPANALPLHNESGAALAGGGTPAATAPGTVAPAAAALAARARGGRPRGTGSTREHVLPDTLNDLKVVSARLSETIDMYSHCAQLEKAGVPGYDRPHHWKARRIPPGHRYWSSLDSSALRQLLACTHILLEANGGFVPQVA